MAAIDKIYITGWNNYCVFYDWVMNNNHELIDKYGNKIQLSEYLFKYKNVDEWCSKGDNPETVVRPVMNNPYCVDAYVIRNCPFDFIQEELMLNYGHWSQERIKAYYNDIKNWKGDGECTYWAKPDDFIFNEDGTMSMKGLEKSDYERILDNELYTIPYRKGVEYGKHFRMINSPKTHGYCNFERPLKGTWLVDIETPDDMGYMWHHDNGNWKNTGTWDFMDEFVISDGASSCTHARTITSLKRKISKWKLPVGTKVRATGRYDAETYEFLITK